MRKFKVNNTNQPKVPSKETIEKYKDFSRLSHAYDHYTKKPKVPLYKDKRMFLFILIIALMAYLLAEAAKESPDKKEQDNIESAE